MDDVTPPTYPIHDPFEVVAGSGRWYYRCDGTVYVGQEDDLYGPFRSREATEHVISVHMTAHDDEEQSA